MNQNSNFEDQLKGKTLLIYWYLLTKRPEITVRELERELNFTSPSIASYHLNKLLSLEILEKDASGKYNISKYVPIGILKHFIRFRGLLLPRYFFLASFYSCVLFFSVLFMFILEPGIFDRIVLILFLFVGSIVSWWETYRLYKLKIL